MITAEALINMQKKSLQEAHNMRFTKGDTEYRIKYKGGIGEYFDIVYRTNKEDDFKFANGFTAYDLASADEVMARAKNLV